MCSLSQIECIAVQISANRRAHHNVAKPHGLDCGGESAPSGAPTRATLPVARA